jgi:uncharacterized protein (DUF486 family)
MAILRAKHRRLLEIIYFFRREYCGLIQDILKVCISVSNIIVGVENHTNFGCAASLVTGRLVSQIGGGINGSFYCWKFVNCHVGMYVYKAAHLKLIVQTTTMLGTFNLFAVVFDMEAKWSKNICNVQNLKKKYI